MTTLAYLMCIQAPITTERNFPIYNNQVLNLQSETEVAVFKFKFKKNIFKHFYSANIMALFWSNLYNNISLRFYRAACNAEAVL